MMHTISWWVLAGLIGGGLGGLPGALAGALLVAAGFEVVNRRRARRWLANPDLARLPTVTRFWAEFLDRIRRLLRAKAGEVEAAERRLSAFLSALQQSPNGFVLLDAQGRIEWCNETAGSHFGIDLSRDQFQPITGLVRDPAFVAYFAAGNYQQETQVSGRGGSAALPQKLAVQLHVYGDGRLLLLSRDVTALAQAEAMRRDFVANVSHEIRTPLTVLTGFIETLQNLELDAAERERYLALMAGQAERMQTLVSDLLTLSRLEGSPTPGFNEWVDLPLLMHPVEDEARGLAQALAMQSGRPHELHLGPVPEVQLAGARSELRSAFSNLVGNALRYTPGGGRVDVAWSLLPDGRLEFSVTDTGPGIAAEHLPRLTERFYRVDQSRSRETGGTGLGLAIVKHVIQRHGGELRIASALGKGSRFSLVFPTNRVRAEPEHV
jgi:two-component system phosphate regulon sensor histidine kinase PhoR